LLRNGVTTFVEFGSQGSVPEALQKEVVHMGTRAAERAGHLNVSFWLSADVLRAVNFRPLHP